jgi:hypothetical protein
VRRCPGGAGTDNSNILFIIIKIELEHADVVVGEARRAEAGEAVALMLMKSVMLLK